MDHEKKTDDSKAYIQDLAAIFQQQLGEVAGQTQDDFASKFPPEVQEIDFKCEDADCLDVIQLTRQEFSQMQEEKRKEAGVTLDQLRREHSTTHHPLKTQRTFDFKLSETELQTLVSQGLVVSSKTFPGFGGAFLTIYNNDLPLYISSDCVLHAWHFSYDKILQEVEMILSDVLTNVLGEMIAVLQSDAVSRLDTAIVADAVDFLSVPRLLLADDEAASAVAVSPRVTRMLELIRAQRTTNVKVFGDEPRDVDFSQFIPRGHYTKSEELKRYFLAMMWLGRTEFTLSLDPKFRADTLCAMVVRHAFKTGNNVEQNCNAMSRLITNFVGPTDSMTFPDFDGFLAATEWDCFSFDYDRDQSRLMQLLNETDLGRQNINSQIRAASDLGDSAALPRAVTFMGQRFTIDSFVMEKTLFPHIPDGVVRRVPSGVDVAFSVFGNNLAGTIATERMQSARDAPGFVAFRDGVPYYNNLEALRKTIELAPETFDESSVYGMWLKVLRTLSLPSSNPCSSLHTDAWNKKKMMSQLSSWTQLRHDNILYVKQSYSIMCGCSYPDALVEPQPEFWESLRDLYSKCADVIEEVGYPATPTKNYRGADYYQNMHVEFLRNSARTINTVREICVSQCAGNKLTEVENNFIHAVTEEQTIGGSGMRRGQWRGWYPGLFYNAPSSCKKTPLLVADVHTNPPDTAIGDPGCVVHEGVGNVRLCYSVVENHEKVPTVFVGPVMTYYEHLTAPDQRLTDTAWGDLLRTNVPELPEWLCEIVTQ